MELLQLDDVSDRLSDERRFQFFFDSGVIGVTKLSDLGGPDNKGEASLRSRTIAATWATQDSGFVHYF